jgi:hypothetical protein
VEETLKDAEVFEEPQGKRTTEKKRLFNAVQRTLLLKKDEISAYMLICN